MSDDSRVPEIDWSDISVSDSDLWEAVKGAAPPGVGAFLTILAGLSVTQIRSVEDQLQTLFTNPSEFVLFIVADWLVSSILGAVSPVIEWILLSFGIVGDALVTVGVSVLTALGPIGEIPLSVLGVLNETIASIVVQLGPAAPIAGVAIWAIVVLGFAIALRSVLEVIQWL